MSLRWKLFRFLQGDSILETLQDENFNGRPLVAQPDTCGGHSKRDVLRKFSRSVSKALCSAHLDGFYALGLEGGFVELFDLRGIDRVRTTEVEELENKQFLIGFFAYDKIVSDVGLCRDVKRGLKPLLVSVGEDAQGASVKVWTCASEGEGKKVIMTSVLRLSSGFVPTCLATWASKEKVEKVAVGGEDGTVTLFLGDIKERATKYVVPSSKSEDVVTNKVVFLGYSNDVLYCVTSGAVEIVSLARRNEKEVVFERRLLDIHGSALGPSSVCTLRLSNDLVIAREEALYFYNPEGRGPCLAFPSGSKSAVVAGFGPYLLHACALPSNPVIVYDLSNKVFAYRGKASIAQVFAHDQEEDLRTVLLVAQDGSLVRLNELALKSRVQMFLERGLFQQAVSLAKAESSNKGNEDSKGLILQTISAYANYLLGKGEYDAAAEQFAQTIGGDVEPSSIISKLVEQPGVRSGLRRYLEALHVAGSTSLFHTKVLITCYRHDRARLAILGSRSDHRRAIPDPEESGEHLAQVLCRVKYSVQDTDCMIEACREAELYNVAADVARSCNRYKLLAKILIEDLNDIEGALDLLKNLPEEDAMKVVEANGHQMLRKAPENFIDLVASLTTKNLVQSRNYAELGSLADVFNDSPKWLARLLRQVLENSRMLHSTSELREGAPLTELESLWLLLFEALVSTDMESVRGACPVSGTYENARSSQALLVLQNPKSLIRLNDALRIAEIYAHPNCLEHLYTALHLYRELGLHLRLHGESVKLLDACRKHGERDPQLWIEGVRHFTPLATKASDDETETEDRKALSECTRELDSTGALSPVQIMNLIIESGRDAPWALVKDYITSSLSFLHDQERLFSKRSLDLCEEISDMDHEISALTNKAVIIKRSICAHCNSNLDLPCVHFFCGHSYHTACIADLEHQPGAVDSSKGCPQCEAEVTRVEAAGKAMAERNMRHEAFFKALGESKDGMKVVMDHLGRCPFK